MKAPQPFGVIHQASASRRMVDRAANEDEARADLQRRIASLFKVMFWSLALLVGFLWGLYSIYGDIAPARRGLVYAGSAVGLGAMAFIWRGLLVRRPLSVRALYAIDMVYSVGIGFAFGTAAVVQRDLRPSAYMSLVYTTYTVFARALIVPSSGRRTALASSATFAPIVASSLVLGFTTTGLDLPGRAFIVGCLVLAGVSIALATAGSHIIYGLRRKVSEAQQLGAYVLDKKIGEGGMGTVYRAHHIMLRRPTAVKRLRADQLGVDNLERFEREVKHMSQLTHPNTVAVYDYGRSADGTFYYAMEYLGGGIDLEQLVARHGPQPATRVARILAQVCGALQEAHDSGFIHRDIKPANIILCERGGLPDIAKVVDFGLAKELTADTGASVQVILGTPGYVAPEAITDPSTIGPGADLYALGAVGYILLTGKRVFEGKTAADTCIKHLTLAPPPPSSVTDNAIPAQLEAIILRCLAKTPEERFASAAELAAALRALPAADWSDARAREWWREFRRREVDAKLSSQAATETITVDLGSRTRLGVRSA
jgi:serine/threonine-protein kinase